MKMPKHWATSRLMQFFINKSDEAGAQYERWAHVALGLARLIPE
jgi:hypothetical protein